VWVFTSASIADPTALSSTPTAFLMLGSSSISSSPKENKNVKLTMLPKQKKACIK
jgi:hypothetical protein